MPLDEEEDDVPPELSALFPLLLCVSEFCVVLLADALELALELEVAFPTSELEPIQESAKYPFLNAASNSCSAGRKSITECPVTKSFGMASSYPLFSTIIPFFANDKNADLTYSSGRICHEKYGKMFINGDKNS